MTPRLGKKIAALLGGVVLSVCHAFQAFFVGFTPCAFFLDFVCDHASHKRYGHAAAQAHKQGLRYHFTKSHFCYLSLKKLPGGVCRRALSLSVIPFRALCLALALSVFFEQFGNLFASFFVADGLGFRGLADNLASLFDEGQADEHLRGRLEVADSPLNAAALCIVVVKAIQRQPVMAAVFTAIVAVATKVAPKDCFGVVRASQHGCLQRGKKGDGVLTDIPQLL